MPSGGTWERWISGHGQARARRRIEEITGTIDGGLAGRSSGWVDQSGRGKRGNRQGGALLKAVGGLFAGVEQSETDETGDDTGFDGDNVAARVAGQYQMVG